MGDWTYKSKWLVTHQPLEVLRSTLAQRCTADVHNTNAPRLLLRPKRRQLAPSPKNKSVVPRMVAPERSLPSDNQNTTQLFPSEEKFKVTVKNHSANTPDLSDLASPQELSLSFSLVPSVVNALFSCSNWLLLSSLLPVHSRSMVSQ